MPNRIRNSGYIVRTNSKGEKIIIPTGFSRTLSALRKYSMNKVESGAIVLPRTQDTILGSVRIESGTIIQDGFVRYVPSITSLDLPIKSTLPENHAYRNVVYVPPITVGVDGEYTTDPNGNRVFVLTKINADVQIAAATNNGYPEIPEGSIVLAKIYYTGTPAAGGVFISGGMIDNSARPKLFEPVGPWRS